jgi:hypothetical protein
MLRDRIGVPAIATGAVAGMRRLGSEILLLTCWLLAPDTERRSP